MKRRIRARRFRPGARLLAAALATAAVAGEAPAADARLQLGRSQWQAGQYAAARNTLLAYRRGPNGRNAFVDYMLGTAGCRIPAHRGWGANTLAFIAHHYSLSPASRRVVAQEYTLCRQGGAMPAVPSGKIDVAISALAGASARGKAGHYLNVDAPQIVFPAYSADTSSDPAFESRRVPVGEAARMEAVLRSVAPAGARISILGRYAFVSTVPHKKKELGGIRKKLDRYLAFLESAYGLRLPDEYLTLYLVSDVSELSRVARSVHNLEVSRTTVAYAFQADQSAVAILPETRTGSLFHELFHLVVRTSFGDVPQWLDEGLGSLYETAGYRGGGIVGVPNWRGPVLERYWDRRPKLQDLIAADWFVSDLAGAAAAAPVSPADRLRQSQEVAAYFATARYFTIYLQETGKLRDVYRAVQRLQPGDSEDPRAAVLAAVSEQIGPIGAVQAGFDQWFERTKGRAGALPNRDLVDPVKPKRRKKPGKCANPVAQMQC